MRKDEIFSKDELKKIESIKRRLNKIGRELQDLDIHLFGWSGSGSLIKYDENARGGAFLIDNLIDLHISGGDPDYEELEEEICW